ncbi:MAG: FAD-containing monooxygenase EthA, partial [Polyangiaceae bacterium]
VTMLQRSPTYIISAPSRDRIADLMRGRVPRESAYAVTRWKNVLLTMAFYAYCRRFPQKAKALLVGQARRQVRGKVDAAHLTPSYKPWDQRVCLVPNGDLFAALRDGRASIVTDHISTFEETGIKLKSGQTIDADLVVTATGLKLKFLGGVGLDVDGTHIVPKETMTYKGMMISGVPNMALALGYTNASWTLKCDLTSEYVCRLLNYMDDKGYAQCCPRRDPSVEEQPIIDFSSGYVQRSLDLFPRQGKEVPWRVHQNYALDLMMLRRARLDDRSMEFSKSDAAAVTAQ